MLRRFLNKRIDHEWRMALKVSAAFFIIGGGWIIFRDRLVLLLFDNPEQHARFQFWEGEFFVTSVSIILLLMIKNYLQRNRKLSESLEQSEERFRYVIEKSVSGICITDKNGVFDYVNSAYCNIYGYSDSELLGKKVTIVFSEEKRQKVLKVLHQLLNKGTSKQILWDAVDKYGNPKKVLCTSMPIIWLNGEKRIVTFVSDITLQLNAQIELRKSEKKYRSMMESLEVPLFITDENCKIIFANKAFRKGFGEMKAEAYCYGSLMNRKKRCSWCKNVQKFQLGERYVREFHDESTGRIYQIIMVPVEFETGILHKMVVMRDLTEIIRAREKAEESDRLKTAFLANMSHEVRTPLNAILGFSSILDDDALPPGERERFVDLIHQSGIQLLNIIDDIVDVARIEQGNLRISMMLVELQPLLKETMDIMRLELADGSKPDLTLTMRNHLPSGFNIQTDPLRLKQVLMNLLGNAIKFTKKGYVNLEVFNNAKEVIFNIEDTGIGIPPEKLDMIFERFRQVDESSTKVAGGNGLGLFISQNFIKQMGGEIRVSSTPGKGSLFTVRLGIPETAVF